MSSSWGDSSFEVFCFMLIGLAVLLTICTFLLLRFIDSMRERLALYLFESTTEFESMIRRETQNIIKESSWLLDAKWYKCSSCRGPLIVEGCSQVQHAFRCTQCGRNFECGHRLTTPMSPQEVQARVNALCREQAKDVMGSRFRRQRIRNASVSRLKTYPAFLVHQEFISLRTELEQAEKRKVYVEMHQAQVEKEKTLLHRDLNRLRTELVQAKGHQAQGNRHQAQAEKDKTLLQSKLTQYQKDAALHGHKLEQIGKENVLLSGKLEQAEKDNALLSGKLDSKQEQDEQFEKQLKYLKAELKQAKLAKEILNSQLQEANQVRKLFVSDSKTKLDALIQEAVQRWRSDQDSLQHQLLEQREAVNDAVTENEAMRSALEEANANAKKQSFHLQSTQLEVQDLIEQMARLKEQIGMERAAVWSERLFWMKKLKLMQEEADNASLYIQAISHKVHQRDAVGCFLRNYIKQHATTVDNETQPKEDSMQRNAIEVKELKEQLIHTKHECKLKEQLLKECGLKVKLMGAELRLLKSDVAEHGIDLHQMKSWSSMMGATQGVKRPESEQASEQASVDANWVYDMSSWDELIESSMPKSSPTASEVNVPTPTTLFFHADQFASAVEVEAEQGAVEVHHMTSTCPAKLNLEEASVSHEVGGASSSLAHEEQVGSSQILILGFNKHPVEFTNAICESTFAQALCQNGVNICPDWANGAKVLIEGLTPALMKEAGFPPEDLRRSHVVVLPEHESDVFDSLRILSYRKRPRERTRDVITCQMEFPVEPPLQGHNDDSDGVQEVEAASPDQGHLMEEDTSGSFSSDLIVSKTFIDIKKDLRVDLSPRSVYTKSSNDRHGIENPRKWK